MSLPAPLPAKGSWNHTELLLATHSSVQRLFATTPLNSLPTYLDAGGSCGFLMKVFNKRMLYFMLIQEVERIGKKDQQWAENPRVGCSIQRLATKARTPAIKNLPSSTGFKQKPAKSGLFLWVSPTTLLRQF
jgi:hypothetical protein